MTVHDLRGNGLEWIDHRSSRDVTAFSEILGGSEPDQSVEMIRVHQNVEELCKIKCLKIAAGHDSNLLDQPCERSRRMRKGAEGVRFG